MMKEAEDKRLAEIRRKQFDLDYGTSYPKKLVSGSF